MKKIILLAMAALFTFAAIAYAQTVPADKVQIKLNEAWSVKPQTQKGVIYNHEPHIKDFKRIIYKECFIIKKPTNTAQLPDFYYVFTTYIIYG